MDENIADVMKLDADIEHFMEKFANSFMKWELVQFFYAHPNQPFRAQELAGSLNRPLKVLRKEMQELREEGFIQEKKTAHSFTYEYQPADAGKDREMKETLDRLIALCHEREGRLRVIYKLLKDGKPIQG